MKASTGRALARAVVPVAVLGALTLVLAVTDAPPDVPVNTAPLSDDTSSYALVLLLTVAPLALRHVAPSLVLVAVVGSAIVNPSADEVWIVQLLAGALAGYTVGERAVDRTRSAVFIVGVAALTTVAALLSGTEPVKALVLPFVVLLPTWLLGDAVRGRRVEKRRRDEAASRARHDREMALRAAAAEERRRVARELHNIVAHTVSVMVVQAGAARKVLARSPEQADGALAAVEGTGREAMIELRHFLGVLTTDDEPAGVAPQPDVGEVAGLVARVREAGLPAQLEIDGDPRTLPASVSVAAYRIVQEALTNALRYAAGAPTIVRVSIEPSQLRIEVSNDGPATPSSIGEGTGRGLVGMVERARLLGGRIETGPRPDGGFTVRAWLPIAVVVTS